MKKISLIIVAIALTFASCKNYDDDFTALNKSIAELQTQVAGFSSLQAGLTALQSSVASLQTTVNALPTTSTSVDLSGLEADLATSLANIAALQADLNTVIGDYATSADLAATQTAIDALTTALATAQADLTALLANNNVYDGNLTINSAASLTFAQSLGAKVAIVNGDVVVNIVTNSLDAAAVSAITSQIMSVTGLVTVVTDAELDFSALTSVGTAYSVTGGADILDAALTNVGTTVVLNYDGGYTQPNLVSSGAITLTDWATTTGTNAQAGTSSVDFSGLTSGSINGGTLSFGVATSVKLNSVAAGAVSVTAPKALTVDMLAANYKTGLTVSAERAGSVVTIAGRVDNGDTTPVGQALSVTGYANSVLNAAAVTKTSTLTVNGIETALSFPALTTATVVTAPATVSFSAPLLVASTSVTLAAAKTVSLASTPTLTAAVVETLTFSALASPYTAAATLKTATVTGKVGSTNGFTSTTGTLVSATFAGELDAVSITGTGSATTDKLTTVTTNGAIGAFTLDNSDVITSISLGHSHIAGGAGSVVFITNNAKLASLTTSTNYLNTLIVTNNALLASMNFASYVNVIGSNTNMSVSIYGNKLVGDYSDAVAVTGTTPYVETVITSADLATLKPFVTAFKVANAADVTNSTNLTGTLTLRVSISDIDAATGAQILTVAMLADTASTTVDDVDTAVADGNTTIAEMLLEPTSGITTVAEFLLIQ